AKDLDLLQVSDESELVLIVEQVLSQQPKAVNDVKNGELKVIGFLVGQVMKASKGKANPETVQVLIKSQLGV
ncbi:MAG: aspartyl-tRNA(Asn)/glutamyl-tRNA(Gln) amidotransferase subunit, partial [Patescibacteria group bacterium]|nr:aspartyl-tRNA(Asn)/glutamyl-tRNA(Gln) amidotransferase subunit [Patescibacteria group bacterium]